MPYPTEHAARIKQPSDFEQGSFRRVNNKFGAGIHAIFGRLKGKTSMDVQAIRFAKGKWTAERAQAWLKDNGYTPVSFEPASAGDADKKKQAQPEEVFSFKEVPAEAMRFGVGEFTVSNANGADAKSAPLKMVARSGQPIEHWYWGKVAHDLAGMRLKGGRVAVDYNHDAKEVIGYLNHFNIANGNLECSGALCPYKEGDRAMEVASKARQGVPYEASINFGGGESVIEEVGEGEEVDVNGYKFNGPGIIFREWPLRGVAVCPYGADQNTMTELTDRTCIVRVAGAELVQDENKDKEKQMADNAEAAAKAAAVEAEAKAKAEADAKALADKAAVEANKPGKRYVDAFGAQGAVWFVDGLSFEEASAKCAEGLKVENAALAKENGELKTKLAAVATAGAAAPAAASAPAPAGDAPKKTFMQLAEEKRAADKTLSLTKAMSLTAKEHPEAYALHRKGGK